MFIQIIQKKVGPLETHGKDILQPVLKKTLEGIPFGKSLKKHF